jgi:DNA-binding winged helix-turn-helix (wHTH) protein
MLTALYGWRSDNAVVASEHESKPRNPSPEHASVIRNEIPFPMNLDSPVPAIEHAAEMRELSVSLFPLQFDPADRPTTPPVEPIGSSRGTIARFAGLTLDLESRELSLRGGRPTHLPGTEFMLLLTFLRHPRQVIARRDLVAGLRGTCRHTSARTVDVYVSRLRRRLRGGRTCSSAIRTCRDEGYVLDATPVFE